MANLLDLSNELIILIVSNLTRPLDFLRMALTSKRVHEIAIKTLYDNVTIDTSDYPLFDPHNDFSGPPYSNLLRLSNMIRSNALPAGQQTTRLSLTLGVTSTANRFQNLCSILLPQLSSLKDLTLISMWDYSQGWWGVDSEPFSLASLGVALGPLSQTLQTLDVHLHLDARQSDGWTIGSFHNFSKLKRLCVQGCALLGRCGSPVVNMPSLDSVLPRGLKYLRLQWYSMPAFEIVEMILETFVEDSVRVSRTMETLVVHLEDRVGSLIERCPVEVLDSTIEAMNEKARAGGLQLELVLNY